MKKFSGFPDRMQFTPVPNILFSALLADIDDLAELKVTLALIRALHEKRGFPRMVRMSELQADRALLVALQSPAGGPPEARLLSGLEKACQRGTLLEVRLLAGEAEDRGFLLNTAYNREMAKRLERGELQLAGVAVPAAGWVALPEPRPSIFDLYEQNIGLLTPLIAEELQQAEESYPAEWIEDAFREAVSYNRRNWRYVRRILENWAVDGRGEDGKGKRHPKGSGSPSRNPGGKYAHLLNR